MKLWQLLEKTDAIGLREDDVDGLAKLEVANLLLSQIVERRALAAACRRAAVDMVPSGPRIQRGSRVRLVHLLTRRVVHLERDPRTDVTRVVVKDDDGNETLSVSDCLRIEDTNSTDAAIWTSGGTVSLQFCGTNASLLSDSKFVSWQAVAQGENGPEGTEWAGELVRQFPPNASHTELATMLSRACEEGGAHRAAEEHLPPRRRGKAL